ncbi:MAG: hypothetical protein LBB81_11100 [Treponema sp.]|jgi:hypothetical protein|nr:hypothetical protein [Treponema sp.]
MKIGNEELAAENKRKIFFVLLCAIVFGNIYAQDFGFDYEDADNPDSVNKPFAVSIGGEASAALLGYFDEFSEGAEYTRLGDIFSGKLNFSARTSFADGVINLKLQTSSQPVSIDEAYVRAYLGGLEIEGGLRKLTWGKADSFGPLDVINPLDYSELTGFSDMMNLKIARPLVHATYRAGSFTKIEGVFVPVFEPLRYAEEGRWVPAQMARLKELQEQGLTYGFEVTVNKPDLSTLKYAQWGARFTTTVGPADIGLQYYYGRLTRPAVTVSYTDAYINVPPIPVPVPVTVPAINFDYNPYHQIGADWAQVLFGFNIRAEAAANITRDLSGDDGSVYNPALLWSFGFDRDLVWGINLNFQCNESIRLMNGKISNNPQDIEADTNMASTQIIAALSKKFLRDELEFRFAALWGIEDGDFLLMPSLIWTRDALSVELSGGIFGGNKDGQFGQYRDNRFIMAALTYKF